LLDCVLEQLPESVVVTTGNLQLVLQTESECGISSNPEAQHRHQGVAAMQSDGAQPKVGDLFWAKAGGTY